MVITMAGQLKQLAIMAALGFAAAFAYDILRASRRALTQSTGIIAIQDVLFWVLCAVCTLLAVFRVNYGEIRLFMLLGMVIGVCVYYAAISPVFLKITAYAAGLVTVCVGFLLRPFRVTAGVLGSIFEFFVNFIKKHLQNFRIYGKIKSGFICKSINVILKKH